VKDACAISDDRFRIEEQKSAVAVAIAAGDPLRTSQLERYDERYVFSVPDLKPIAQRLEWLTTSPALVSASRPELDCVR
jgi:hypothetical protein